jgi:glycosyltransferase involved in cell wall biosynthesis
MPQPIYVLVTPVRDEVNTIRKTLEAVAGQTHRPAEWVIVSDSSTDGTDEIITDFARSEKWIKLIRRDRNNSPRSFAAVVKNTELGIGLLETVDYSFIGLLDADVSFQSEYFERLIGYFDRNPRLGLAGGVVVDVGSENRHGPRNGLDVPGAVQFFRRDCFLSLGGLIPVPEGGWDGITCATARMNGYETQLVRDLIVDHLKPRNSCEGNRFRRYFQFGVRDYAVGYSLTFATIKWVSRAADAPAILGATAALLGYFSAALHRRPRIVPAHIVRFIRTEQRLRLVRLVHTGQPALVKRESGLTGSDH